MMTPYVLVALGSGLGGVLRYGLSQLAFLMEGVAPQSAVWSTITINVVGSLLIGWIGSATAQHGAHPLGSGARLFLMVGVCGGFTTFSAFSLQTFDLLRSGSPGRALANILLSVVLCVGAVALGYHLGRGGAAHGTVAETASEERAA